MDTDNVSDAIPTTPHSTIINTHPPILLYLKSVAHTMNAYNAQSIVIVNRIFEIVKYIFATFFFISFVCLLFNLFISFLFLLTKAAGALLFFIG